MDCDDVNSILKLNVVGDGAVGKTCLFISYVKKTFPDVYVPTVFDQEPEPPIVRVDDRDYKLALWDTGGGVGVCCTLLCANPNCHAHSFVQ